MPLYHCPSTFTGSAISAALLSAGYCRSVMRQWTVYSHVLILGCGRSGTSIFSELFEHLGAYTYYSEPSFADVAALSFSTPVAIKVPKECDEFQSTPGLSFPLDAMLALLPKPVKIYWQVRHPLDAIASLRVGIADNWGHHPRPPDWKNWLKRSVVERCAHHWSYINSVGYGQVSDLVEVCQFEEMLTNPRDFAARICADVGADRAANATGIATWSERVQDTNNENFKEAKTSRYYSRPDHIHRLGRWKENLGNDELRQIVPIVRSGAGAFGYLLPDEGVFEPQV
ncbi:MAG: sulfotransferase [bacterium]|nr:sulfotransferase [bacterium]